MPSLIEKGEFWIVASCPQALESYYKGWRDADPRLRWAPVHFKEGSKEAAQWKKHWVKAMKQAMQDAADMADSKHGKVATVWIVAILGGGKGCAEERKEIAKWTEELMDAEEHGEMPFKTEVVELVHEDLQALLQDADQASMRYSMEELMAALGI